MRVIAFSCVHLCSAETQLEVQEHNYNYDNIRALLEICKETKPDLIVNLGDFTEPMYDSEETSGQLILKEIPLYWKLPFMRRIVGNHDKNRTTGTMVEADNVRYEHGHQLIGPRAFQTRDEYVEAIRDATKNLSFKMVHGHTHFPQEGNPLDVGSITFSGTYGEIIDGKEFYLRSV